MWAADRRALAPRELRHAAAAKSFRRGESTIQRRMAVPSIGVSLARHGALYILLALTVGYAAGLAFDGDEAKQVRIRVPPLLSNC